LDTKGLKRLGLAFLRKYKDNMEQRMKHAEQPEKFLDSEVDLDEHIKSLLQAGLGMGGLVIISCKFISRSS
jgi:beta-catenin-like protein 1